MVVLVDALVALVEKGPLADPRTYRRFSFITCKGTHKRRPHRVRASIAFNMASAEVTAIFEYTWRCGRQLIDLMYLRVRVGGRCDALVAAQVCWHLPIQAWHAAPQDAVQVVLDTARSRPCPTHTHTQC